MDETKTHFECPQCGQRIVIPASAAGQTGLCPSCRAVIVSPGLEEECASEADFPATGEESTFVADIPLVTSPDFRRGVERVTEFLDAVHAMQIVEVDTPPDINFLKRHGDSEARPSIETILQAARTAVLSDLKAQAADRSADAVVSLHVHIGALGQSRMMVSATGTPVRLGASVSK